MSSDDPSSTSSVASPVDTEASSTSDPSPDSAEATDGSQSDASETIDGGRERSGASGDEADSPSPFLRAVRAPIADDAPTGQDILYDEDYRTLKAEIDAIGAASGEPDYEAVVSRAREILTEKSKDLRVAAYLVLGQARCRGAEGLAEGLRGLRALIEEYWEELYPAVSRMRGRGNALQFIGDRLPDWMANADFDAEHREALVSALEDIEEVQAFSLDEMGEHAPALSGLKDELQSVVSDLPEEEGDPASESAADENRSEAETSEREGPSDASPEGKEERSAGGTGAVDSESDAIRAVHTAARFYRKEVLTNPLSYSLLRTVRWGPLRSPPPNEQGTTHFEPPRSQRREYLRGLLEDGEYKTLVREGETSLQGGTFHVWLDLQRLVASALDGLGDSYEDARTAVRTELFILLRRIPSLPSLTYSDGTPFASSMTVDWIDAEIHSLGDEGEGDGPGGTSADRAEEISGDYDEAKKELAAGNLEAALSVLREGTSAEASRREAFRRRLYAARLCVKAGRLRVARPLLDQLDGEVQRHRIDDWNPTLALEVWRARRECFSRLAREGSGEETEDLRKEARRAFEKICRIDPAQALSME